MKDRGRPWATNGQKFLCELCTVFSPTLLFSARRREIESFSLPLLLPRGHGCDFHVHTYLQENFLFHSSFVAAVSPTSPRRRPYFSMEIPFSHKLNVRTHGRCFQISLEVFSPGLGFAKSSSFIPPDKKIGHRPKDDDGQCLHIGQGSKKNCFLNPLAISSVWTRKK